MAKLHTLPEEKKRNTLPLKLAALGILLVAGGITTFVFGNKKPAVKKTTGNVLGTEINVNSLQKKIETVSKPYISDLENASQSLLNSASQTVASLAADSADQAKNYALTVTLEKLIDQVNKLPQPAQEEIKKQICK